jgi:uncharacterized protein (DUF983 family)
MRTVRPTTDGKHRTLSDGRSKGFTLICRQSGESIRFGGVRGCMTYCPMCGLEFGEWGQTESQR